MRKVIGFLNGFLLGALLGGGLVLLLTPQSGQQLQESVRGHINQAIEEGRRAAAERRAELEAQFAQAKQVKHGS